MSFRFRMYLADGEDLDDYVAYIDGRPRYRISAVIPVSSLDNEVYAGIWEVAGDAESGPSEGVESTGGGGKNALRQKRPSRPAQGHPSRRSAADQGTARRAVRGSGPGGGVD